MTTKIIFVIIAIVALASNITLTYNLIKITKRIERRKQLPIEKPVTFNLNRKPEMISEETELLSEDYTTEFINES